MSPENRYALNPGWALLLNDVGVNTSNVLRRAGLPQDLFVREETSIAAEDYYALWDALSDETGDPALPISVANAISLEAFDPAIFAATCSRNLNVAAARIAQHKKLIAPTRLTVAQSPDETELELRWPEHAPPPQALAMTELLFWVALARLATRAPIRPLRITTSEPPSEPAPYDDYLGIRISKGPSHTVVFSAQDAARPFLTANEAMWEFFQPELRRRLSGLEADTTVADRVRAALLELLPAGDSSMEAVSNELAVSTRTLQRRLKEEGTSYQEVLNNTRESLARHYLSNSDLPAGEISFLLGYEDPHSFYRAFNSWTGLTPQRARAAAAV